MDNDSPLYLAHQNGRNAEKFLKKRAFDQAIECHQKATALLQEAMTLTSFDRSLESLQLQKNYHLTQTHIIRQQKLQYNLKKQLIELRRKKRMEKRKLSEGNQKDKELQWTILRTMDKADTLISQIGDKHDAEGDANIGSNSKQMKDEKTDVEELKLVNAQLRSLISKLFSQLESSYREEESLRSRLKLYEGQTLPDLAPLELPNLDFSHP